MCVRAKEWWYQKENGQKLGENCGGQKDLGHPTRLMFLTMFNFALSMGDYVRVMNIRQKEHKTRFLGNVGSPRNT